MTFLKNLSVALFLLSAFFANAQDVTIGNTTLIKRDIATGIQVPWEVQWGADDHLWVTERRGQILRIEPETGMVQTVLDHRNPVQQVGESGMLGLALHPSFPDSAFVYTVYTYGNGGNLTERLVRFEFNGTSLINETILLDGIAAGFIHNGSRLVISPDKKIMMTVGDDGSPQRSQSLDNLNGKLLRINLDGSIPSDNPIPDSYIYSYGHRNAQGLTYGPNGYLYSSEHGQSNSDEVNFIEPNRNYGWPNVEGACNTAMEMTFCNANNVKEPMTEFSPCLAINDLIYYDHPAIPELQNSLLMAVLGGFGNNVPQIRQLQLDLDQTTILEENTYFQGLGRLRDICINPYTGALIIATNGSSYPGSGPNTIIEYSNQSFVPVHAPKNAEADFLRIQPNPATAASIRFEVSERFLGAQYEVISFDGKSVEEGIVAATNFGLRQNDLSVGSYFLRVTNKDGFITRIFVLK